MSVFLCSRSLGLLKHYFSSKSWKPKLKRVYHYSETSVLVRLPSLTETAHTCIIFYLYFNITWITRGLEDHKKHFCYLLLEALLAQLFFTSVLGYRMWTAKGCLMSQVYKLNTHRPYLQLFKMHHSCTVRAVAFEAQLLPVYLSDIKHIILSAVKWKIQNHTHRVGRGLKFLIFQSWLIPKIHCTL